MYIKKHLIQLFVKSWEGKLSRKEKKELDQWFAISPKNREAYDRLSLQNALNLLKKHEDNNPDRSAILSDVENAGAETPAVPAKKGIPLSKAACLLLVSASVAASILLVFKMDRPDPKKYFDIHDKVMITFADGSRIFPDTVKGELSIVQDNLLLQIDSNGIRCITISSKDPGESLTVFNEIKIPRCRRYSVVLPDESNVILNANSVIRFPVSFAGNKRVIELTGEAFFKVRSVYDNNKKLPFVVHVKTPEGIRQDVTVTGTTFNIRAYGGEFGIKTTLLEGAVRVKSNEKVYSLSPCEELLTTATTRRNKIARDELNYTIAWKTGYFSFNHDPIRVILYELARWYDVDIDPLINFPEKEFTGMFSRKISLEEILATLSEYFEYKFILKDRQITISKDN